MKKLIISTLILAFSAFSFIYHSEMGVSPSLTDLTLQNLAHAQSNDDPENDDDTCLSCGPDGVDDNDNSSGWLWKAKMTNTPCDYDKTEKWYICGGILTRIAAGSGCYETTVTVHYKGKVKNCIDGWNLCKSGCVGDESNAG